ncbi:hypothetical protein F1559_000622 [Cyanidiococcus yangmingshanensis]|uniref:N-acetyltransferase domain-containing protein n=1 Tax=Cyanidiococcus yangmingshanensis TaxID=2690220 RepID=A0A7J7IDK1_9RHOD|nr:hypothetical protein F1559_000622 [Cyanidiococcus yangmingshanensis]
MPECTWLETYIGRSLRLRNWRLEDCDATAQLVARVLAEFGLQWEPNGADADVLAVKQAYFAHGGEFFVLEDGECSEIVGTAAWQPLTRSPEAPIRVEVRKMYLERMYRRRGLGRFLLAFLEARIRQSSWCSLEVVIESASVLQAACALYRQAGYRDLSEANRTYRCDVILVKELEPLWPTSFSNADRSWNHGNDCVDEIRASEEVDLDAERETGRHCFNDLVALANSAAPETGAVMAWLPSAIRQLVPALWRVSLWIVQREVAEQRVMYLWYGTGAPTGASEPTCRQWHFLHLSWWRHAARTGLLAAQDDAQMMLGTCEGFWQALVPGPIQKHPLRMEWPGGLLLADLYLLRLVEADRFMHKTLHTGEQCWCAWDQLSERIRNTHAPMMAISQEILRLLQSSRFWFD